MQVRGVGGARVLRACSSVGAVKRVMVDAEGFCAAASRRHLASAAAPIAPVLPPTKSTKPVSSSSSSSATAASYSELSAPLTRAQIDATLAALPVRASLRAPLLVKSLAIDERLPFWVNSRDVNALPAYGVRVSARAARDLWKLTGFNYFTLFGAYGLVKTRMPFVAVRNPFTARIEVSPHPETHADQPVARLRLKQEELLQTMVTKLDNNINGCMFRYKRLMKLAGMGYRIASVAPHPTHPQQRVVEFQLGRSHLIPFALPAAVQIKVLTKRGTVFRLMSSDYEAMQQVAMGIRQLKPPETYTGKGVVFWGETVVKKEGKKK